MRFWPELRPRPAGKAYDTLSQTPSWLWRDIPPHNLPRFSHLKLMGRGYCPNIVYKPTWNYGIPNDVIWYQLRVAVCR